MVFIKILCCQLLFLRANCRVLFFQSEEGWVYAKKHIERWKTLISLYPELRKFNFDVTEPDYVPLLSQRKINLDAV